MKEFFGKNGGILFVIALLLSLIIAGGSIIMTGSVDPISNLISNLLSPLRNATATVTNWGEEVYDFVVHYEEMEQKANALEQELADAQRELREASEALRENERLRELLNLQEKRRDFTFESARITARSFTGWEATLGLDKGTKAGVALGDCVVTETGNLVGVISQVGENFSTVSTLISSDLKMGGMVERSYSTGILEGDFALMSEGKLRMTYLDEKTQLVAGDQVVTSGMGEIYPQGLLVGKITSVEDQPSGMDRYAVIQPEVDLHDLVQVFIIKDFDMIA